MIAKKIAIHRPLLFEESATGSFWWAALRSQYVEHYDLEITTELLAQLAADYDVAIERGAVKLDHVHFGVSHGWIERLELRGDVLWALVKDLSDEAVADLRSKKRRRISAELRQRHPSTKRFYFTGLALLGAASPAIKGLPEPSVEESGSETSLQESVVYVFAETENKGETMAGNPLGAPAPAPPAAEPDKAEPAVVPLAESAETIKSLRDTLAVLTRERAEAAVDRHLAELSDRLTPAAAKEARPALVGLYLSDASATGAFGTLLKAFSALPPHGLDKTPLAAEDDGLALAEGASGVDPARAKELRDKYQVK